MDNSSIEADDPYATGFADPEDSINTWAKGKPRHRWWLYVELLLLALLLTGAWLLTTGCTKKREIVVTREGDSNAYVVKDAEDLEALMTGKAVAVTAVPQAATVCPTPRQLPPWAPPGINYCTEPRYYIRRCEASPWIQQYQQPPGATAQGCSAHTWIVYASDGFAYPIIDQGTGGKGYPKPPTSAPEALAVWTQCFINHVPPGGGYDCNQPAPSGTLVYNPKKLSEIPEPYKTNFYNFYACCNYVTPTAVPPPTLTPPPVPPTAPPGCPTLKPDTVCIQVTVTPRPQ